MERTGLNFFLRLCFRHHQRNIKVDVDADVDAIVMCEQGQKICSNLPSAFAILFDICRKMQM